MSVLDQYRSRLVQAMRKLEQLEAELVAERGARHEPIAIIGTGCRFPPGVDTPEAFFARLEAGEDAVSEVPASRFSVTPEAGGARYGGFLGDVAGFDAGFFGLSPREAQRLDPQQRLLLEVSWEALERAGQPPARLTEVAVGVFVGLTATDYAQLSLASDPETRDAYTVTGNGHCFAAGRLAYSFGFRGPTLTVDTACSSSLVAIHLAVSSLRRREAALALAGGVNLILSPTAGLLLAKTNALARDGRCKAFDAGADGFVRGEGCGVVVLKRLADAERDGDPIVGIVRGSAVNQDGRSTGLTTPNVRSQEAMLRQALEDAGVAASELGYIETHGTGTSLGDPIEFEALRAVIGAPRPDGSRCVLGAVKTNVGHLEAAAGMAGLVKALMCLRRGLVPKNLHFEALNPRMSLDGTCLQLPSRAQPWPATDEPRRCGVSAFGLSGTNAHVILEEPPPVSERPTDPPRAELVTLSAKSPAALTALAAATADAVSELALPDVAYTSTVRREHHEHRLAVVARSSAQLAEALAAPTLTGAATGRPRRVFVFSGQGSQWPGMALDLLHEPAFAEAFEAVDSRVEGHLGWSIAEALAASPDASRLDATEVAQPALLAVEVALAALLASWGVTPDAVIGHSVGEIAAAHVVGALSLDDAVRLVCLRGRSMQPTEGRGRMAAVTASVEVITAALAGLEDRVSIAAINAARSCVLAGEPAAVDEALARLGADGVRTTVLRMPYAFHSPQMASSQREVAAALTGLVPVEGRVPIFSTVTGARVSGSDLDAAYWARNVGEPVRFAAAVATARAGGHALFVEVGPHPVLSLDIGAGAIPTLRRGRDARRSVLEALGALHIHGSPVAWERVYPSGAVVPLPTYRWDRQRYWLPAPADRDAVDELSLVEDAWRGQPLSGAVATGRWAIIGDGALASALAECLGAPRVSHVDAAWLRERADVGEPFDALALVEPAGVAEALALVRAALMQSVPPAVWLLTRRGLQDPEQAALWGLARVLAAEHPEAWGGIVDVEDTADAELCCASLSRADGEDRVAIRDGVRYVARLEPRPAGLPAPPLVLRTDARYVVVGDDDAAHEVAAWLVARGAGEVVVDAGEDSATAPSLDAGDRPLAGVFVTAAVHDQGVLLNETPERLAQVLAPARCAAQLDHETRGRGLDLFVLLTSAAAVLGPVGHAAHAASAAYLAGVARARRAAGEHALCVAFGDDGLSAHDRLRGVERLLAEDATFAAVLGDAPPAESTSAAAAEDSPPLAAELCAAPPAARRTRLIALVQREVERVLGIEPPARAPLGRGFFDLGMDSLTAVELKNRLQRRLGRAVLPTAVFDHPSIDALASCLDEALAGPAAPDDALLRSRPAAAPHEPIAIVGLACRFPGGANDPEAFWRLLGAEQDAIIEVPEDRWDREAFHDPDPDAPGKMYVSRSGFLQGHAVDQFDAAFFNLSPREASGLDPQQRMLLELTWEALEDAGRSPDRLVGSQTGVYVGIATADYSYITGQDGLDRIDPYAGIGNAMNTAAGRLSFVLGLRGPAVALDTACSSSLVAAHLACQSLRRGETDLALVGGVNLILAPILNVLYSRMRALAPDGRCKAFDARADGMVRGEGGAVLVLARERDARAAGDRIYAVIRGSAVNHDGRSSGITVPNGTAQRAVLRAALADAGVAPASVRLVETHGTGTELGDPIEANALCAELGPGREPDAPLVLGAAKDRVGHLEAAAGLVGLIKVIKALEHEQIPPQLHFERLNPQIDPRGCPLRVPTTPVPWPRNGQPRVAGVSSFGVSGTNAHIVIADPESPASAPQPAQAPPGDAWLLPVSARSPRALRQLAAGYRDLLDQPSADVAAVCAAASLRRAHLERRLAVTGRTREQLVAALDAYLVGDLHPRFSTGLVPPDSVPRLGFVFSGHGGHWDGMGRTLRAREPVFREALDACDAALRSHGGGDGVQPRVFALQVALTALWRSWGIEPAAVVGHSMGEIAAAHVAGVLSLDDAAGLCCRRSEILARLDGRGGMAIIGLSLADTRAVLAERDDRIDVAVSNSRRSTAVSGDGEAIAELMRVLTERNVFVRPINGRGAGHGPQLDPMLPGFIAALDGLAPAPATVPLYSTVTAAPVVGDELGPAYWARNLRDPVLFADTVERLDADGIDAFLEIGPHPMLVSAIEQTLRPRGGAVTLASSLKANEPEAATLLASLGRLFAVGVPIDFPRLYPHGSRFVPLPGYPWQRERHWGPIANYRATSATPTEGGGADEVGHPLLRHHVVSPRPPHEHLWEIDIESGAVPTVKLQGLSVVPAMFYAELALVAARETWPGRAVALGGFAVDEALVTGDEPGTLQLALHPEAGTIEVMSRRGTTWRRLARGRIVDDTGPTAEPLAAVRARLTEQRDGAEVVARLRERELVAVGLIDSAAFGSSEVLARVSGTLAASFDAGCQLLSMLALDDGAPPVPGDVVLPVAFDRLDADGGTGRRALWCHAVLRPGPSPVGDLTLHDDAGVVVARVTGVRLDPPDRALARRVVASRWHDWLYTLAWQPKPRDPTSQTPPGPWVIVADEQHYADALARRLTEQGATVRLVTGGAPTEAQLLGAHGVIHLGSLDAARPDDTTVATLAQDAVGGATTLVRLVQALARAGHPRLYLVTRNAQPVGPGRDLAVAQAPVWGLAKTIAVEHPESWGRLVDLDADTPPERAAAEVIAELCAQEPGDDGEDFVAWRGGARHVLRLDRLSPPPLAEAPLRLRDDAAYLVTGGLGGVGLELARWLCDRGARSLFLVGRRAPSAAAAATIATLEARGARVRVLAADIADPASASAALAQIHAAGLELRGVFHAAGVSAPMVLTQTDPETIASVFRPKVAGAWVLHALTRALTLDLFVCFSSAAAVWGAAGLGPYAAANHFMDVLAHHRRAQGLPALSVDWGGWATGGMTTPEVRRIAARMGLTVAPSTQMLEALDGLIQSQRVQATIAHVDWRAFKPLFEARRRRPLFENIEVQSDAADDAGAGGIARELLATPAAARYDLLLTHVRAAVAQVLGVADPLGIDRDHGFFQLGMDSVMSVQLRDRLEVGLGRELPATLAFEHPSVDALTEYCARELGPSLLPVPPSPTSPGDALDHLSTAELEALLAAELDGGR